jgi:drug/metabolite transporter (DMT)-like permease
MRLSPTPRLALLLAILAVSWGAILVRFCQAPALVIAFYRLAFATAILLPFSLASTPWKSPVPRRRWIGLAALAGFFLSLHFGAWITSLSYTSVASSVVLVSTQPLFSALLSRRVLGERAPARLYLGVVLALAGTALIAQADRAVSSARLWGDFLALAGAAAASAYYVIGRRMRAEMRFSSYLALVYGVSALFLAAAAISAGEEIGRPPRGDTFWYLVMAAGPMVVGHGCFNWAVRRMEVFYVNLAAFGEPVLASLYAFLLFGEPLTASLFGGGILVFAGILLALPRPGKEPWQEG